MPIVNSLILAQILCRLTVISAGKTEVTTEVTPAIEQWLSVISAYYLYVAFPCLLSRLNMIQYLTSVSIPHSACPDDRMDAQCWHHIKNYDKFIAAERAIYDKA